MDILVCFCSISFVFYFYFLFFLLLIIENSRGIVRIRGGKEDRNGKIYVKFHQLDCNIEIGKSKFHLNNLFNGDPVLSEIGNQFVNENSDLFLAEIIPGLEKSLANIFLNIVNTILKDVTFDEMFPNE